MKYFLMYRDIDDELCEEQFKNYDDLIKAFSHPDGFWPTLYLKRAEEGYSSVPEIIVIYSVDDEGYPRVTYTSLREAMLEMSRVKDFTELYEEMEGLEINVAEAKN